MLRAEAGAQVTLPPEVMMPSYPVKLKPDLKRHIVAGGVKLHKAMMAPMLCASHSPLSERAFVERENAVMDLVWLLCVVCAVYLISWAVSLSEMALLYKSKPKEEVPFWASCLRGDGSMVLRARIGLANLGGVFSHGFEVLCGDEDWLCRYYDMLGVLEEPSIEGSTWRELYGSLSGQTTGFEATVFEGDAERYMESGLERAKRDGGLRALMRDTALKQAFSSRAELEAFEAAYPHVTRDAASLKARVRMMRSSLSSCDFIGLLGAKNVELNALQDYGWTSVLKPDAHVAVLCRSIPPEEAPLCLELSKEHNFFDLETRSASRLDVAPVPPFFETSTLPAADKRRGLAAMTKTRQRTLGVDAGALVIFAVKAAPHHYCADYLAAYLADLAAAVAPKPSVFCLDCGLNSPLDLQALEEGLQARRLLEGDPPFLTQFRKPTIFHSETPITTLPDPPRPFFDAPESLNALYEIDAQLNAPKVGTPELAQRSIPQFNFAAPKDRVIYTADTISLVDRTLCPSQYAPFARAESDRLASLIGDVEPSMHSPFVLPTKTWPSDHLALVVNLLLKVRGPSLSASLFSPTYQ